MSYYFSQESYPSNWK